MTALPEFRLDVADAEKLRALTTAPVPLDLKASDLKRAMYRDVYYDTSDAELYQRGVAVRMRHTMDDRRFLTVRVGATLMGGAFRGGDEYTAEVTAEPPEGALAGTSDPARRLKAIIDASRLEARVELTIDREYREARKGFLPLPQFELGFNAITVRQGDLTTTYHQMDVRQVRRSRVKAEDIAQAISDAHNLRIVMTDPIERAMSSISTLESDGLAEAVKKHNEVVVVAVEGRRIAMVRGIDDIRLPNAAGSGEDAAREALREALGSPEGQLTHMGIVPATQTRPAIDVWLARRLPREQANTNTLQWFLPGEIVARAGSPVLRDSKTLAALTIASRSELLPEWSATAGGDWRGETVLPTDEFAASSRQTLMELTVPILREEALDADTRAPEQYINAELSWLEFNARVLGLAEDPTVPLLARLRFLAIFATNLDEFFQVKVAGLKQAAAAGVTDTSPDGLTPPEQLDAIAIRLRGLVERQYAALDQLVGKELPQHGIVIRRWTDLNEEERAHLTRYFDQEAFPMLTPRAITRAPGHPFPMIEELQLSIAVMVRDPKTNRTHFAQLKVPDALDRFIQLPDSRAFVPLEEIVRANAGSLYPGREVLEVHPFRLVRAGDIDVDEQAAASFAQAIEEEIRRRPIAPVVRLDVEASMPQEIREVLIRELRFEEGGQAAGFTEADLFEVPGLVDLSALGDIANMDIDELDYPKYQAANPFPKDRSIFEVIDEGDKLVHHPYDSFADTFERFIVEAADDPDVVAIKLTLYRPGGPSELGDAIKRAAEHGKDVSVFVELKARFDEQRNIFWAKQLERARIHVVTGLVEYKTHAKIAVVVRKTDGRLRRYAQISTGNYNPNSSKLYTDVGLFTSDPHITAEVQTLFNELTGSTKPPEYDFQHILVSPTTLRKRFRKLIKREIEHAEAGRPAGVRAKMNALGDPKTISTLYQASQAGVDVDLIIRGFCILRPGVPSLSERIKVISLLGRFLEHARIFVFENGGDPEYYVGSADWRPRNLKRRVEVVTPVRDPEAKARLEYIMQTELEDPTAWIMSSDGTYEQGIRQPEVVSAQDEFMRGTDPSKSPEAATA